MVKTMSYKKIIICIVLVAVVGAIVLCCVRKTNVSRNIENIAVSAGDVVVLGNDGKPVQLSVDIYKIDESDGKLYSAASGTDTVQMWID